MNYKITRTRKIAWKKPHTFTYHLQLGPLAVPAVYGARSSDHAVAVITSETHGSVGLVVSQVNELGVGMREVRRRLAFPCRTIQMDFSHTHSSVCTFHILAIELKWTLNSLEISRSTSSKTTFRPSQPLAVCSTCDDLWWANQLEAFLTGDGGLFSDFILYLVSVLSAAVRHGWGRACDPYELC